MELYDKAYVYGDTEITGILTASNLIENAEVLPANPVFETCTASNFKGPANSAYLANFDSGLRTTSAQGVQTNMIRDQTGVSLLQFQFGSMVHKQQSVFEKDIAIINNNKLVCTQIDVETIDPGQGKYLHVKQTLDMENNDARNIGLCEATSIMAGTANVGGKLTTTDLDVLGQLATSNVDAATVTAGKYVIKTHNNAVADALLYNVNLPNTLICPMLTFRANELQCA